MATIALYANKLNAMSTLIGDVTKSISGYTSELFSLKQKTLNVEKRICNLDDVICSIQSSTQVQEQKNSSLNAFSQNNENFIADVVSIDGAVADAVNQSKDDFYDQYNYLKPECEKSGWDKFCDGLKGVGEWCKEHWVVIVTVLVVIAIAILCVVTFGIALAAVAAIAGIISLVMCLADVICMIATGGKDIAAVCRENGLGWLGEIFQGITIGCDFVSIALPAGAAIKSMVKVGAKTFAKASITTMKIAFKETTEKLFKSGFKQGVKNFGKLMFNTFILDIDDLKNWKAVKLSLPGPNMHWRIEGDSLIPNANTIPGLSNPDGLSMAEIMKKYGVDSIPLKNGVPDMSVFSKKDVPISMKNLKPSISDDFFSGNLSEKDFSDALRDMNFKNADAALLEKYGLTKTGLEASLNTKLTWHEDISMGQCSLIPTEIHANLGHIGGVGNFKFEFKQIPGLSKLVGEKTAQFEFRFGSENLVGALASN